MNIGTAHLRKDELGNIFYQCMTVDCHGYPPRITLEVNKAAGSKGRERSPEFYIRIGDNPRGRTSRAGEAYLYVGQPKEDGTRSVYVYGTFKPHPNAKPIGLMAYPIGEMDAPGEPEAFDFGNTNLRKTSKMTRLIDKDKLAPETEPSDESMGDEIPV